MKEKMYYVFGTCPAMYVGAVHEGGLDILFKYSDGDGILFQGICDCIGCFKLMIRCTGRPLNHMMIDTMYDVWMKEDDDYSFPKCCNCDDIEDDFYLECEESVYSINPAKRLKHHEIMRLYVLLDSPLSNDVIFSNFPLDNFKEFNLEKQYGTRVHFRCYIDRVYSPKLVNGHLEQIIKITDKNTKKTIKCDISKFADYDKWEKNQKIELTGEYHSEDGTIIVDRISIIDNPTKTKKDTNSIRQSPEYNRWRDKIKEVGECFICGRKNHLVAHHINSVSEYPELALDEKNGVCLCKAHHDIYHEDFSNTGDALSFAKFVSIHKNATGGK